MSFRRKPPIDATVRRLVDFSSRSGRTDITPVEPGGWDNRTFRLGDRMSVRLPSAAAYAAQVDKEHAWLRSCAPASASGYLATSSGPAWARLPMEVVRRHRLDGVPALVNLRLG